MHLSVKVKGAYVAEDLFAGVNRSCAYRIREAGNDSMISTEKRVGDLRNDDVLRLRWCDAVLHRSVDHCGRSAADGDQVSWSKGGRGESPNRNDPVPRRFAIQFSRRKKRTDDLECDLEKGEAVRPRKVR